MFSPATIEAIRSYVYALTEGHQIFYVGKGEGNRVFQHVEEVRSLLTVNANCIPDASDSDDEVLAYQKQDRIAQILRRGDTPGMYILREGLSPEQALLLEAVIISVLDWQLRDSLANEIAGHGTSQFGFKSVAELEATKGQPFRVSDLPDIASSEEVIAINVNRRWAEVVVGGATLLSVSCGRWKLNRVRAARCPYAIVHANGVVRGVFEIAGLNGPDEKGRYTFDFGDEALVGGNFSNKNAASLFGASGIGTQNPIRYVKIPR